MKPKSNIGYYDHTEQCKLKIMLGAYSDIYIYLLWKIRIINYLTNVDWAMADVCVL